MRCKFKRALRSGFLASDSFFQIDLSFVFVYFAVKKSWEVKPKIDAAPFTIQHTRALPAPADFECTAKLREFIGMHYINTWIKIMEKST